MESQSVGGQSLKDDNPISFCCRLLLERVPHLRFTNHEISASPWCIGPHGRQLTIQVLTEVDINLLLSVEIDPLNFEPRFNMPVDAALHHICSTSS